MDFEQHIVAKKEISQIDQLIREVRRIADSLETALGKGRKQENALVSALLAE